MSIPIYKAEIEAGLAGAINKNSFIISSVLEPSKTSISKEEIKNLNISEANSQFDLYSLNTILVTVGWNKNTDIFDKAETWAARGTAEDKPLNINHDHTKIVGHITSCSVINAEGKVLSNDLPLDDVPDFYHILTSAVLYRALKDEAKELREEIETVISEITEGKWYVSMECLFRGFDYGMVDAGVQKVISRTQDTAFLTKYLKAYGGSGEYNGKKIGRVLRNITFSGKGLVKNPANPYSIIIAEQFKPVIAEFGGEMKPEELEVKLGLVEAKLEQVTASEKQVKIELVEANEKITKLADKVEKVKAERDELSDKKDKKNEKIEKLEAQVALMSTESAAAIKKLEGERDKNLELYTTVKAENDRIKAEAKLVTRKTALAGKEIDEKAAVALLTKLDSFDEDAFATVIAVIPNKAVATAKIVPVPKEELKTEVVTAGTVVPAPTETAKAALTSELEAFFKSNKETK